MLSVALRLWGHRALGTGTKSQPTRLGRLGSGDCNPPRCHPKGPGFGWGSLLFTPLPLRGCVSGGSYGTQPQSLASIAAASCCRGIPPRL